MKPPPPPDCYTKFRQKAPQKAGTYTYTMSMWDPPVKMTLKIDASPDCPAILPLKTDHKFTLIKRNIHYNSQWWTVLEKDQ